MYIQTQHQASLLLALKDSQQDQYLQTLLAKQEQYQLPPYQHLACFIMRGDKHIMNRYMPMIQLGSFDHTVVHGPQPFPPGNRRHQICYQLIITSSSRQHRHQVCHDIRHILEAKLPRSIKITWQIDSHLST